MGAGIVERHPGLGHPALLSSCPGFLDGKWLLNVRLGKEDGYLRADLRLQSVH